MVEPFLGIIWQRITSRLKPGMSIRNWTVLKGCLGDEISIVKVSGDRIMISTPNAKYDQNIPARDFEAVWEIWPAYKAGKVQRKTLTPLTRYSKTIISILHWLENE